MAGPARPLLQLVLMTVALAIACGGIGLPQAAAQLRQSSPTVLAQLPQPPGAMRSDGTSLSSVADRDVAGRAFALGELIAILMALFNFFLVLFAYFLWRATTAMARAFDLQAREYRRLADATQAMIEAVRTGVTAAETSAAAAKMSVEANLLLARSGGRDMACLPNSRARPD